MKTYEFEIDGHTDIYFRVFDVKEFFLKPIYKEDVKNAIEAIKAEIVMRKQVFKGDKIKCDRKVKEMELPLRVLTRCSGQFPELQKEMFANE